MDEIAESLYSLEYKGIRKTENVYDNWLDNIQELMDAKHSMQWSLSMTFKTNPIQ